MKPNFFLTPFQIFLVSFFLLGQFALSQEFEIHKRQVIKDTEVLNAEKWKYDQTAVVVCDMWDAHHCLNAVRRVNEMAPRMNELLLVMRKRGSLIIHAPSSCMDYYKDHPARVRATKVPRSKSMPDGITKWCDHIPAEEDYPLDQSDGGEDDDPEEHARWAKELKSWGRNPRAPWKSQVKAIQISTEDYISDRGDEVWSILENRKIKNVVMVGVHTNMCVLGRPFGLRQLSKNGKNVVLVRDLTDTMYNPKSWPFVDHYQGNRLIHRHIEKYVCGTITSNQILGGEPLRFKNDRPPKCLILCAETIYDTKKTLKNFSQKVLQNKLGFDCTMLVAGEGEHKFDSRIIDLIKSTDLVMLSMRRRALPEAQLKAVRDYLAQGKPLVALRTSSHAFDAKGKHAKGHSEWKEFDAEVLGCNYQGHHANDLECKIEKTDGHELLTGVDSLVVTRGSLYRSNPLGPNCTALLFGKVKDHPREPLAWTNQFGKARIFYTSLGHKSDFENQGFLKLLENGVRWATEKKIGKEPTRKK